jgi:hypothetical protein
LKEIVNNSIRNALTVFTPIVLKSGKIKIPEFDGTDFEELLHFLEAITKLFAHKFIIIFSDFDQFLLYVLRMKILHDENKEHMNFHIQANDYLKYIITFFLCNDQVTDKVLLFGI